MGGAAVIAVVSSLASCPDPESEPEPTSSSRAELMLPGAVGRRDGEVIEQRTARCIQRDLSGIGLPVDALSGGQDLVGGGAVTVLVVVLTGDVAAGINGDAAGIGCRAAAAESREQKVKLPSSRQVSCGSTVMVTVCSDDTVARRVPPR